MNRSPASLALVLVALLSGGCGATDGCDEVCELAVPVFSSCIEQWGLGWGPEVGYDSAEDYADWCTTYNSERRLLAETAEDPEAAEEALTETCSGQAATLESGECGAYWGVFADAVP